MKKLLILMLIAICAISWRSESFLQYMGVARAISAPQPATAQSLTTAANSKPLTGISMKEYAELAKSDPDAYRKFLQSHQQEPERSEVDKLLNFFARLKYE